MINKMNNEDKVKCFHFCTGDFLTELQNKGVVVANDTINLLEPKDAASYAKEYAFITKQLNNGNGMFFAWSNPEYKGVVKVCSGGKYRLLELEVPKDECILTNYQNWCSFGTDLFDVDGDLDAADILCREEFGIVDGLQGSYDAIFDISDELDERQVLLYRLNSEWIKSIRVCGVKYV